MTTVMSAEQYLFLVLGIELITVLIIIFLAGVTGYVKRTTHFFKRLSYTNIGIFFSLAVLVLIQVVYCVSVDIISCGDNVAFMQSLDWTSSALEGVSGLIWVIVHFMITIFGAGLVIIVFMGEENSETLKNCKSS